jgi:hypothetical protein
MKTKCFNLVRHSVRHCADGKCEAELIQRPAESDYDFSRRIYCGACEKIKRKPRREAPRDCHAVAEALGRRGADPVASDAPTGNEGQVDQFASVACSGCSGSGACACACPPPQAA